MKPPMRQEVTAYVPITDAQGNMEVDRQGIPKTKEVISIARVQFKSQLVVDSQGRERRVSLEVDLPPVFNPGTGSKLGYTTIDGYKGQGTIVAKEEVINLTGSKVYYRTVFVDV